VWRRRGERKEREAEGDNPRVAIGFCNYRGENTITLRRKPQLHFNPVSREGPVAGGGGGGGLER
jgi:hypothetical protein